MSLHSLGRRVFSSFVFWWPQAFWLLYDFYLCLFHVYLCVFMLPSFCKETIHIEFFNQAFFILTSYICNQFLRIITGDQDINYIVSEAYSSNTNKIKNEVVLFKCIPFTLSSFDLFIYIMNRIALELTMKFSMQESSGILQIWRFMTMSKRPSFT